MHLELAGCYRAIGCWLHYGYISEVLEKCRAGDSTGWVLNLRKLVVVEKNVAWDLSLILY